MSSALTGGVLSIASAICWSLAIVFFRRASDVPAFAINLFKNSFAFVLTAATLLVLGVGVDTERSVEDFARLLGSGLLGLGFADAVFLHALKGLGPGLAAIVETAYAPSVVLFSILLLGEPIGGGFLVGASLVVGGVLVASEPWRMGRASRTGAVRARDIALGAFAVACMGLGIVIAKPALGRSHVVEASLVRMVGALGFQAVVALALPSMRVSLGVLRPGPHWRQILPSAILGSYFAMIFWLGGMKLAPAPVAAVLGQTSTIFTLLFARALYAEPLTRPRSVGALLACAGAAIIVGDVAV